MYEKLENIFIEISEKVSETSIWRYIVGDFFYRDKNLPRRSEQFNNHMFHMLCTSIDV